MRRVTIAALSDRRGARLAVAAVWIVIAGWGAAARAANDTEDPGPPAAQAPEGAGNIPGPRDRPRENAVYGVIGFGAPLGVAGAEYVRHFGRWLEVGAGLGAGFAAIESGTHANPLQWAVMPRARLSVDDRDAVTFGVGVSGGEYGAVRPLFSNIGYCDGCQPPPVQAMRYVVWANAELGAEVRRRGFALRIFGGIARGCTTDGCSGTADGGSLFNPYFGAGFGGAF